MWSWVPYVSTVAVSLGFTRFALWVTGGNLTQALGLSAVLAWSEIQGTCMADESHALPMLRQTSTWVGLGLIAVNLVMAWYIATAYLTDFGVSSHLEIPREIILAALGPRYNYLQLVAYLVVYDVLYYPMHVVLHWKPLYKHIHLVHHQATLRLGGVDALYMHPFEAFLTVWLLFVTAHFWAPESPQMILDLSAIALKNTLWAHAGYTNPGMPSPVHYIHHKLHRWNYSNVFMDFLFGTFREN
jgi:sterol desaturase/sphingolipid hydroxylase (fatty acid hydroxylase superfamily)